MEWGSVIGLVLAFSGILAGQLMEGGHVSSLIQGSAFCIVVSGTVGAVLLQNGLANTYLGLKLVKWVFVPPVVDRELSIKTLVRFATVAKREGLLSLQNYIGDMPTNFSNNALQLIVDNTDAEKLQVILENEISSKESSLKDAAKVWDAAGGYAPTIGIIGAILGLIHVMENLSDPSKLGAGIAVAFVATIYGVALANLVFLPIGANLKKIISTQINEMEMLSEGLVAIASGDNSLTVEARMRSFE
jgi:chemotaxis protein MotA